MSFYPKICNFNAFFPFFYVIILCFSFPLLIFSLNLIFFYFFPQQSFSSPKRKEPAKTDVNKSSVHHGSNIEFYVISKDDFFIWKNCILDLTLFNGKFKFNLISPPIKCKINFYQFFPVKKQRTFFVAEHAVCERWLLPDHLC